MTTKHPPDLRAADTSPVSIRIVKAVARAEGTEPIDLDRPLYHAVDTDALDTLFSTETSIRTVTFDYMGYGITVESDGEVSVNEPPH